MMSEAEAKRVMREVVERSREITANIPLLDSLSLNTLTEEFIRKGRPVVFRAIEGYPVCLNLETPWQPFSDSLRNLALKVRFGDYANPKVYSTNRSYRMERAHDFISQVMNSSDAQKTGYVGNNVLSFEEAALFKIQDFSPYREADFTTPRLWLGPKGAVTPLHADGLDNFAVHLAGLKKWRIFPPCDFEKFEMAIPYPRSAPSLHTSMLDLRSERKDDWTEIALTLAPGSVLYLPAGWSHYVETLSHSLMINFWLDPELLLPAVIESVV